MSNKLTIVTIAAEVRPFSQAGGVADVSAQLSKALFRLRHDVIVVTPLHGSIDLEKHKLQQIAENIPVTIDETGMRYVNFWKSELMDGLPVYFIDNPKYFSSHKRIYGTQYQNTRYLFFDLAVFKLLNFLQLSPDILHCHDWQTGLVPLFLNKRFRQNPLFTKTKTVYTIHNLTFQLGRDWWTIPQEEKDDTRGQLPAFTDKERIENVNFAKRAILNTDIINTVSETYAKEILTQEFGQELHRILQKRRDRFFGIINGIDYFDYNPATDPGLYRNYDRNSLSLKTKNKLFLQREYGLPEDERIPVIGMVSRITEQKGFDLLREIIEPLMRLDLQFAILGGGEKEYIKFLKGVMKKYPKKAAGHLEFNMDLATRFYAGSDMFLMPSRFEPCGIGQLISLRYGSIPIVHAVGGLTDTITDYNPRTGRGLGFVFKTYDSRDMLVAVVRALEVYKDSSRWSRLVEQGMRQSYSWEIPARKYVTLYKKAFTVTRQQE